MSTITQNKFTVTEKAIDHAVDGVCAVGIVASVAIGQPDTQVIGGLVTIALGKRAIK
jgi:hypothetical protein